MTYLIDNATNDFKIYTIGDKRSSERKYVSLISTEILKEVILSQFKFSTQLVKKGEDYSIEIKELDLTVDGPTKDATIEKTVNQVKTLSQDYIEKSDFYLRHPDKKMTVIYPYYLRLLYCESDEEIIKTINIETCI